MAEQEKVEKMASEGHVLVVLCAQCGELKRRKYRSDALQWQRQHLAEHSRHEVEIVERLSEEAARGSRRRAV
jgi:RNase P subunit RPR2